MGPDRWNRRFPRDIAALDAIFDFVRAYVDEEGLEEGCAHDAGLVLEELFTNLVRHNRGVEAIEISLGRAGDDLLLTVRDFDVDPFDPTARASAAAAAVGPADLTPGGRGILLVRHLSKEFTYDYSDRTSTLTARLDAHRERES